MKLAIMIPPKYLNETPKGERHIFDLLQNDPDTKDWIVLHSYGISHHRTKRSAEIDLVVLVPKIGILCLEVKGSIVSRKNGLWNYGYKSSVEGPFRQSSTAMHALRDSIVRRDSRLNNILFWSGVVFTSQTFQENSPEWYSWQFIDKSHLNSPISNLIVQILESAHKHSASRSGADFWYHEKSSRPTADQIRWIANIMRGDFEPYFDPKDMVKYAEKSIKSLTEEQYSVLDSLQDNNRILVDGLAGTGKTILAIEATRRAITEGASVLFLCYNVLLAKWIANKFKKFAENGSGSVKTVHIHGLMREIVGGTVPRSASNEYWAEDLPDQALEKLWDLKNQSKYDLLVVDEGQDILKDSYLDLLDELLDGGLDRGRWQIFGDFTNQSIYLGNTGGSGSGLIEVLSSRSVSFARHRLFINCRNAEKIVTNLTMVCGLSPSYSKTISDVEGAKVEPVFWKNEDEQKVLLANKLSDLKEIFDDWQIVILSPLKDESSCASILAVSEKVALYPLRKTDDDSRRIHYASIHAFKGLESAAVIITDIVNLSLEQRSILYVAMSRARIRLVLMMSIGCREAYSELLLRSLS